MLRTSSGSAEAELFVFLSEEIDLEDCTLGTDLGSELSASQWTRLAAWARGRFDVALSVHAGTALDIVEAIEARLLQSNNDKDDETELESAVVLPLVDANQSSTVRLLTYNVNFALCRGEAGVAERKVAEAIREGAADVVLLEESHSGWRLYLEREGAVARYGHRWHLDDERASGGLAVYSRFPLLQSTVVDLRRKVRGAWFPGAVHWVLVPESGAVVALVHVHLRPSLEDDGSASGLSAARTAPIRRREMLALLRAAAEGGGEVVVAGDMNEEADGLVSSLR